MIILAVRGDTLRRIMLLASEMGLTKGDFVYISTHYYKQRKIFGDFSWKQVELNNTVGGATRGRMLITEFCSASFGTA